jgi:hypothetical protein
MNRLDKFLSLAARDQRLVASAWLYLLATQIALTVVSFRTLLSWSAKLAVPAVTQTRAELSSTPERISWAVRIASRYVPRGGNCLLQAIATQVMLARTGHSAHIRIGAAKDEARRFKAHAWVECDGRVVIGGPSVSEFSPFPRLGARR